MAAPTGPLPAGRAAAPYPGVWGPPLPKASRKNWSVLGGGGGGKPVVVEFLQGVEETCGMFYTARLC